MTRVLRAAAFSIAPLFMATGWLAAQTAPSDLQGIWTNMTVTPLERPRNLGDKQFFTPQEAADFEKKFIEANNRDRRDGGAEAGLLAGARAEEKRAAGKTAKKPPK